MSFVAFDDRFQFYMKLIEEVDNMPLVKDQEFIRLRTDPLAQSIKQHAKQWMDCYGKMLLESSTAGLKDLHDMLLNKSEDLDQSTDSLEELKFILRTITDIRNMSLDVANRTRDLQERFRIMEVYGIQVQTIKLVQ